MYIAETLVPEPICLDVGIAIEKLKNYEPPCHGQIAMELIKTRGNT